MSDVRSFSVPIHADVEREDKILANLTARQLAILASAAVVLWLLFMAVRDLVPLVVFAAPGLPIAGAATAAALMTRDGLSLDRLLLAALRQARTPPAHGRPSRAVSGPAGLGGGAEPVAARTGAPARPGDPARAEQPSEGRQSQTITYLVTLRRTGHRGRVPVGARISAGKFGSVDRSLPKPAVSAVNRSPVRCIPSPESPASGSRPGRAV